MFTRVERSEGPSPVSDGVCRDLCGGEFPIVSQENSTVNLEIIEGRSNSSLLKERDFRPSVVTSQWTDVSYSPTPPLGSPR